MDKKLVAVLYKKLEPGPALNAVGHMALGLAGMISKYGELESLMLDDYTDGSGTKHPSISDYPFIVLRGGIGQIKNLANLAKAQNIHCIHFLDTMTIGSYKDQKEATLKRKDIDYLGICMFGDEEIVSNLTKKLSLWK